MTPSAQLDEQAPDPVISACPVGETVETSAGPWGLGTASFSSDRLYRYRLSRVWDAGLARVNFLLLNPSTADAFKLDPTVRRCTGFAQAWSMGSVEITNAFALRSTDPRALRLVPDPVGAGNDGAILAAALAADLVIAAWGVRATHLGRERQVRDLLAGAGVVVHTLHLTRHGHPGHPLYLPGAAVPVPWLT